MNRSPHTPPTNSVIAGFRDQTTYTPPLNRLVTENYQDQEKYKYASRERSREKSHHKDRDFVDYAEDTDSRHYQIPTNKISQTCLIAELIKDKKNQRGFLDEVIKNSTENNKIETIVSRRPDPINEFGMEEHGNNNNDIMWNLPNQEHQNETTKIKSNGTKIPAKPKIPAAVVQKKVEIPEKLAPPKEDTQIKKPARKSLLSLPMPPGAANPQSFALSTNSNSKNHEKLSASLKMGVSYFNSSEKPFSASANIISSPSSSDSVENAKKALLSRLESRARHAEKVLKHPSILNRSPPNPNAWNDRCVESFSILNRIGEGTYGEF